MINSPMGPGDEIIVPGDLECSCNMVSSIWSFEGKTYRSNCDNWGWITVTVTWALGWNDGHMGPSGFL